jgi:hypothetical protein
MNQWDAIDQLGYNVWAGMFEHIVWNDHTGTASYVAGSMPRSIIRSFFSRKANWRSQDRPLDRNRANDLI